MNKPFAPQSPTSKKPYHKAGSMELAHVPSEHAHRIIASNRAGDTATGGKADNKTGGGKVGPSKGGQRYAGNLNAH